MGRKNRKQIKNLKQRSLIAHYNPKSPIAEQYRTIRTNIQFSSIDKEIKTIMVTSSEPGEGKSTTAANLAVVMAQQGKRILLVDTDMRKPTMHYTFRVNNTRGLTNVLTKQMTLEEAAAATEIEDLDILPSGPIPPNPAELVGSKAMDNLIETALTPYDLIIFDTPPVLAVTDGQVMANRCDGTILVTSSGKTENESALNAKELLEKSKAKILGVVLNRKPQKDSDYHYYYG